METERIVTVPGRSLSAHYVPARCDPATTDGEEERLHILVGEAAPFVSISSPRRGIPLERSNTDRVLLSLDATLVGPNAGNIGVQETGDPYLFGVGHSLRCGFRYGHLPPPEYLEIIALSVSDHVRQNYPVRVGKRLRQGLSPERLARVLALIEERSNENLPVETLASAVHMSPFHFTRMFRRSTGLPPHEYITMRR